MSFVKEKLETIEHLKPLFTRIQVEIDHQIVRIRSDRERDFDNVDVDFFCELKCIKHEFFSPLNSLIEWSG